MSAAPDRRHLGPDSLARRLRPLQAGVGLQGCMLWVPVEKLFQTQIGFDAAAIAVMAAAYAALVPLFEIPSGILADRWSRTGILIISSVAAAASALLGGLSHNVATYIGAALILGVYFAMNSGTIDSVVYDAVIEETGSPDLYEQRIGRVRIVESAAFTTSALVGGLVADVTSPRLTYFLTVPFVLASIIAFSRFREPRLHRAAEPLALRKHVAITVQAMTRIPSVRRNLLLAALAALLSQAVFEFGPLWLVALHAPAAAFGPYWALLTATLGAGGYLAARLNLGRRPAALTVAAVLVGTPVLFVTSHMVLVIVAAQTVLALTLALTGIHAGRLLHDAVPSHIRAGVSSGAGTFSWMLFLPFSIGFGAVARTRGVYEAGWIFIGTCAVLAALLALSARAARGAPVEAGALAVAAAGDWLPEEPRPELSPPPSDIACQQVVRLVSDYLDGDLPPGWRDSITAHLTACDGCTAYLEQIRQTVELLEQIDVSRRRPAPSRPAEQAGTCKGAHP